MLLYLVLAVVGAAVVVGLMATPSVLHGRNAADRAAATGVLAGAAVVALLGLALLAGASVPV
ncbi:MULTISPECIES: hypothetical protein [Actinoalloteichus]|uniref:Uncharacterized protein n=1 Tax=Actinoalloteichus fjordicus TaxID=1612552 RepID=A0AAC9LCA1_9PSEU|nr:MULTISPECIES: hypothetical protein [Actinoalloteichus]APU15318.1 hypothetical protein UA74_16370 [Actinoalloteichus fjordicus]APU21387.1 hypothetical protein UA75_16915 [Actinoalloteichus sp. GBA129-24]